ncbi:TlpA family protein disulfide reductase [Caldibacillus debilis]|uniref:Thiol-disulfide isomerase and thioredoxin n=1 Tax=Caldibacillus debilis GB1 TaxID=1339248 RepID=A0A420VDV8_9BACI|nr:TlpA disulfide reductase family protein [Caldibacillus debilis]RKO61867.1 Thiol-disulfide isomerase and thioredoxin [Caldibacillus debilis GB1]
MEEDKKKRNIKKSALIKGGIASIIALFVLVFALWWVFTHLGKDTENEGKDAAATETGEEVRFEEKPVTIDYSKEPEEILAQYTEQGMNLFKVNFPDTLSMNYALKNIGKEAVEISGKTVDGKDFSLSALKGKNVILTFAKTACSVCKEMSPILAELAKKNPDVTFVTLFPVDNNKDIDGYYKSLKLKRPDLVLSLENNKGLKSLAINQYMVSQVPTFVFVDESGRISYTYIGSKDAIMFQDMIDTAFGDEKLYDYVRTITIRVDENGKEISEEELIKKDAIDKDSVDHNGTSATKSSKESGKNKN